MDRKQSQALLEKYNNGTCTTEEKALIDRWYLLEASKQPAAKAPEDLDAEEALIWSRISANLPLGPKVKRLNVTRWAAAASVLIAVSAGLYFYKHKANKSSNVVVLKASDIKAGSNKAVLILANGSKVILDDQHKGLIASQSGITVSRNKAGAIVYQQNAANIPETDLYNTIQTPTGQLAFVTLQDGTKAWLNASSSLRYPVNFKGTQRVVELTGEAYFEVKHNAKMPFRVKTAGQVVNDIGTSFDINAYADEPAVQTTLLEGRVSVQALSGNSSKFLVPGQQANLIGEVIGVRKVTPKQFVAWKDGFFELDHTDLYSLMRQVSRWYNLKIVYQGNVKNDQFFGEVDRKYSLAELLKVLELGGLHFRVEGSVNNNEPKQLIIIP